MRFTASIVALFAATALATPSPSVYSSAVGRSTLTSTDDMTNAIQFAVQADCDIFQCANVIASAACIAAGVGTGQVEAVLACVASGATGICPCAGCIDALNDFLTSNGVCT
ncbi:hypothetical protein BDV96DRAFT_607555 [Lophiotrema nucula]|uniref:Fungal calcium binding protein domain-containing protein n=1 Tax=Lophiotrema nucula TaxID=690887 RepID=A0A6A5YIZ7_9PLEO|nr:hypothetical protein BDV96DRAFT_607555 [Lophiotrema nucula]